MWRTIKADWDNWQKRDLANEDVVRLILDGTTVRLDRKSTSISLLVVLGLQKLLLAVTAPPDPLPSTRPRTPLGIFQHHSGRDLGGRTTANHPFVSSSAGFDAGR